MQFYCLYAFMFNAEKGKKYYLKFNTEGGAMTKLFTVSYSKTAPAKP